MTTTAVRRSPRVPGALIWGAALAVHALAFWIADGVVVAHGRAGEGRAAAGAPAGAPAEREEVALETTCAGDARLAALARGALCLAPWSPGVEGCLAEAELVMRIELSSCRARNEPLAAVAVVPPAQIEKIPPIEPEQLEDLEPLEQPPPPPPPPPILQPQPQVPPPPPPPPPPAPPKQAQVVETVKPSSEKEPDNARFLAEHNTHVEKQTVARGARNEPMVARSKPEELTPKERPKDEPSVPKPPEDKLPGQNDRAPDVPGKLSMRAPGAPAQRPETPQEAHTRGAPGGARSPIVADGFVPRAGDHAIEQQRRDPGEQTPGQGGAGGGAPRVVDLRPSQEVLERAAGGGSVDHLEEVESGEETALTAKRWVHASFFNRVKRQVAMNWDPQTVWRRSDPTGQHHGFKTRVTELRVSLSPRGEVTKVVVMSPSGVSELDEEAMRAFRAAAPFPNPPDALVKDNLITFAFAFHFTIGEPRTSWRVLRQ